jgi:signal transduction histidine kinase
VGIAAHAVRLTSDLQRSRERLVTAREEERRRLRRDLHDSLGPTLAALALKATTVSDLIPTNPAAATQLSNELYADIRATVGEIRRLVYALRPPRLDDLGLIEAIREAARQQSQPDGLQITVEAPERLPALPAAIEVATYRIVQEALANVARHAQAHACTIWLTLGEALQVEITDDGVGLPPEHHSGVGLLSMRERATELGGTCLIAGNAGGGTRVCARLPISSERQEGVNGTAARADC